MDKGTSGEPALSVAAALCGLPHTSSHERSRRERSRPTWGPLPLSSAAPPEVDWKDPTGSDGGPRRIQSSLSSHAQRCTRKIMWSLHAAAATGYSFPESFFPCILCLLSNAHWAKARRQAGKGMSAPHLFGGPLCSLRPQWGRDLELLLSRCQK